MLLLLITSIFSSFSFAMPQDPDHCRDAWVPKQGYEIRRKTDSYTTGHSDLRISSSESVAFEFKEGDLALLAPPPGTVGKFRLIEILSIRETNQGGLHVYVRAAQSSGDLTSSDIDRLLDEEEILRIRPLPPAKSQNDHEAVSSEPSKTCLLKRMSLFNLKSRERAARQEAASQGYAIFNCGCGKHSKLYLSLLERDKSHPVDSQGRLRLTSKIVKMGVGSHIGMRVETDNGKYGIKPYLLTRVGTNPQDGIWIRALSKSREGKLHLSPEIQVRSDELPRLRPLNDERKISISTKDWADLKMLALWKGVD